MDFNSLNRLRNRRYSYRIISFIFACISCASVAYYFSEVQAEHIQTVWNFRAIKHLSEPEIILQDNVTYQISWEGNAIPYYLIFNDVGYMVKNVNWDYPPIWKSRYHWFNFALNNPFRIRLRKKYSLGLIFNPPHVYQDKNPFELSRDFFYTTGWKVEQVSDTPKFTGQLITDKDIE